MSKPVEIWQMFQITAGRETLTQTVCVTREDAERNGAGTTVPRTKLAIHYSAYGVGGVDRLECVHHGLPNFRPRMEWEKEPRRVYAEYTYEWRPFPGTLSDFMEAYTAASLALLTPFTHE